MVSHQACCKNYMIIICLAVLLPTAVLGDSKCEDEAGQQQDNRHEALKFKLIAIATIMVAGGIGVSLPQLGKKVNALNPENDIFFMIKAFAAGVILATGFVHILPEAFSTLTSPCLKENLWKNFPFAGFIAMMSSIGTLIVDTMASSYYKRSHFKKDRQAVMDEEKVEDNEHEGHVRIHTHATHGHGSALLSQDQQTKLTDLTRHRVISQVLELGIIVHSIIIGITLGASERPDTIKTLLAALSFHQFFEGLGLGGCILQAKFKSLHTTTMAVFFSLTTPMGIAIGIGISHVYSENTPTALIVQGIFNSASAGILIYMALVDLLAADFMDQRMQSNSRLQIAANVSLLLGAGCMSVLAMWA